MSRKYTPDELLDKITWEGSVVAAIQYGIKADDVPAEVADLWDAAQGMMQELEESQAAILGRLHAIQDEQEEEWEEEWGEDDDDADDDLWGLPTEE